MCYDVETAYLLVEAAEALGRAKDPQTWKVARLLVDHAVLDWGWDNEHGGFYDKGGSFAGEAFDRKKVWWTQAEGLNAPCSCMKSSNGTPIATENPFSNSGPFIEKHMIDPVHGGWYAETNREGKLSATRRRPTSGRPTTTRRVPMNVATTLERLN